MRLQVVKFWNRLRSSFWFVPSIMAFAAVVLAQGGVAADQPLTQWLSDSLGWEFTGGAEGASVMLGNIAGSMINIAGVVFSMTLVALSLASSQLGPRLLRNFMRDTSTQVVLGTFIATFNQLVEMAVRALSPGINDPFTAIACVDHLGAVSRIAARSMPNPHSYDSNEQLRLIRQPQTYAEIVDAAFNQIRQYGRSSASVTIRLLDTIAVIAQFVNRTEDREAQARRDDRPGRPRRTSRGRGPRGRGKTLASGLQSHSGELIVPEYALRRVDSTRIGV